MLSLIPTTIFIRRGLLTDISFFLSFFPSSYCIQLGCGLKKATRNLRNLFLSQGCHSSQFQLMWMVFLQKSYLYQGNVVPPIPATRSNRSYPRPFHVLDPPPVVVSVMSCKSNSFLHLCLGDS
ncbi:hypothetical protein BDB00DRAFT_35137 [Zychaea mexicana]|uniref:uncharacterized protein n=1 Tax=Zychaea mexicana TaxID=64656 RepID=UPI0022FF12DA|nr:uncharacterized protein BDB00DRAFT_35137 [Zychaea mexicana]KAI9488670.1 hypothetical protein BDB00DRAFT_35137 [Zychaea mexicana]